MSDERKTEMSVDTAEATEAVRSLEARLAAIECLLGLMASRSDREGRTVYLAFQLAGGREGEALTDAFERLEAVAPGVLRRAEDYARDMHGQEAAALLRP